MRKLTISFLVASMLTLPSVTFANHAWHGPKHIHGHHHKHGHWHRTHGGAWVWVPALIIGGAVGAAIAKDNQQSQVIVQTTPTNVVVECSEWKEIQMPDGKIYRERTCVQKQ